MSARSDSWYAEVPEEELAKLYSMARRGAQWFEVVKAANDELGLNVHPSRSAYYRWIDWMREQDSERRLAQARIAALEADQLAKGVGLNDDTAIMAYKSLAAEMALKTGNAKEAGHFMRMATDLIDRQLHAREVELQARAQATKDEQLRLAREKFEFDAAKKAMELAAEIKSVAADDSLDDDEKIAKVREALFGSSHTSQKS